jgi:hypothetical protein
MIGSTTIPLKENCTVIESIYGDVKLIKRSRESAPALVTLSFSNLQDCLAYADKNQFRINIVYSGRKKNQGEVSRLPSPIGFRWF